MEYAYICGSRDECKLCRDAKATLEKFTNQQPSSSVRTLRASTTQKTKESFINQKLKHLPNNLSHWVENCKEIIDTGMLFLARLGPVAWKASLKSKYVPKIIEKNVDLSSDLEMLNSFYYDKIMGDTVS